MYVNLVDIAVFFDFLVLVRGNDPPVEFQFAGFEGSDDIIEHVVTFTMFLHVIQTLHG